MEETKTNFSHLVIDARQGFFHAMLSYRVTSDKELVTKIHDKLHLLAPNASKSASQENQLLDSSPFPKGFKRDDGTLNSRLRVFLDVCCLKDGVGWEGDGDVKSGGFVGALRLSPVFVPLFSATEIVYENTELAQQGSGKGSIGQMINLAHKDSQDNVLLELIVARELHLMYKNSSKTNDEKVLAPCSYIFPLFRQQTVWTAASSLPKTASALTNAKAKKVLKQMGILDKNISVELRNETLTVHAVWEFFKQFQGIKLYERGEEQFQVLAAANAIIAVIDEVESIVAEFKFHDFESDNPVAHELLDFIRQQGIEHIGPSLVKSDVTSLKIFSQLTSEWIKLIAQDSCKVSKRPLIREIADIEIGVQAAKVSPYILPVSERLAKFHDEEASFMTIAYSTFAMEQVLLKPFFGKFLISSLAIFFSILCAYQFYQSELIFGIVNLPRAIGLSSIWFCIHVLKDIQLGRMAMLNAFVAQGLAAIAAVFVIDKIENGAVEWDISLYCSKNYHISKLPTCVQYLYSYYVWQSFFYLLMSAFILWRQEFCWRWWNIACSVQVTLSLAFQIILGSQSLYDYFGVVVFPTLLIGTEWLKFYGTLQAIWSMRKSKNSLDKSWCKILDPKQEKGEKSDKQESDTKESDTKESDTKESDTKESGKDTLSKLVKLVNDECECSLFVLDHSKDLGKWEASRVAVEPPIIHQPTCDFDELYDRAVSLNDVFQQWIGSFFIPKGDPSSFVYISQNEAKRQAAQRELSIMLERLSKVEQELAAGETALQGEGAGRDNEGDAARARCLELEQEFATLRAEADRLQAVVDASEAGPALSVERAVEVEASAAASDQRMHKPMQKQKEPIENRKQTDDAFMLPFKGTVIRGPVKRPHRAIAKVNFPCCDCEIYMSIYQ
jgi:arsenate reductase-like glutaredoxin family protein